MDGACWVCFLANIHPSRTWLSGSFESMQWSACVTRLDLGVYSHPKVLGNGVRTHVNSKGKIPSTRKNLLRGGSNPRYCIKQDSEPNTLPVSYSGPHQAGQPAQHTTSELFRPPSGRTASPTHYQWAIPAPIRQDSQPNTLPVSYSGPRTASPTHYQWAIPAPGQPAQHTTSELFRPQDSQPNTLPVSYSGPHQAGQPAQHTTSELFRPPSGRTASPTHYQWAIPAPGQPAQHTTSELFRPQDSQPNTLPVSYSGPRTASPTHYQWAIPAPIRQDSQPNTLPMSYSGPHQAGQPAQHTTNQLFRPPSNRTASPTHHQWAIPAPVCLTEHRSLLTLEGGTSATFSPIPLSFRPSMLWCSGLSSEHSSSLSAILFRSKFTTFLKSISYFIPV